VNILKNLSDQASSIKSDCIKICADLKDLSIKDKEVLLNPYTKRPVPNVVNKYFKVFSSNLNFCNFSKGQKVILNQNTALNFSEKTTQFSFNGAPCPIVADATLD
jgi:hypothetical protein